MPAEHVEPMRVAWADADPGGRIHVTAARRSAELAEREVGVAGRHTVHLDGERRRSPLRGAVRDGLA